MAARRYLSGLGLATEAALALRDWAIATLKLPSLVSYMSPDNAMFAAVARDWAASSIRQRQETTRTIASTPIARAERSRMKHHQFRNPVTSGTLCSLSGLRVT